MLRRIFGTEKVREDSPLARSLKGLENEDLENNISQSLPDLTIGRPSVQLSPDPKERRGGRREEIKTERPKTSEDSLIGGSVCSEPSGTGHTLQVDAHPSMMYSSIDSLLAVPKAEIQRVPHNHAFKMKKSLSSKRNTDTLSDASAASSPRNSFGVIDSSSTAANHLPMESQATTPLKKSEEDLEETPREGLSVESRLDPSSADNKATKRANKKSRKQRYKTVTGSELLVPVAVQRNPDGGIHSDSESALTRSIPGWRSASLKGTPRGKGEKEAEETKVQVLKNEVTPARALTSTVPISKLDDYVVLVSDQLDEHGDIQAVKVTAPLPLKEEDLATYLQVTS